MPPVAPTLENRSIRMFGSYEEADLRVKCAIVEEGLSQLTRTRIEFFSRNRSLDLKGLVGQSMNLEVERGDGSVRKFPGTCISAEYLGVSGGYGHFLAEVRPRLWFLTLRRNSRIFQGKKVDGILQEVLSEYGLWGDVMKKLSQPYQPREFCLQYRESDFDFLSRLMEEEGIYYAFNHEGDVEKLLLADDAGAHQDVPGHAKIGYMPREEAVRDREDYIYEWCAGHAGATGKVTLKDYDFESPRAQGVVARSIVTGSHTYATLEHYDYPGGYRVPDSGDQPAKEQRVVKARMEGLAAGASTRTGVCNVRGLGVGYTFTLTDAPIGRDDNTAFLVTGARHTLRIDDDWFQERALPGSLTFGADEGDNYRCTFEAIPGDVAYRAPRTTPTPVIPGVQTAIVVGPEGEEIHTDEYGRVRIQFHWDREGRNDQHSSVWVRTAMPWTGKNWGMIAVPRIGQEVVVQFEEGNPDRPIITGMLYNADTMPPYKLPENMTQSGVKTNSSKGGHGYNEVMFEDKKGAELMRLHAQKDSEQTILNNSTITVGQEKAPEGDMTMSVFRHLSETVKTGDHTFKVEQGNQTLSVKVDKTETVEGKSELTVTKDVTEAIKEGNYAFTLDSGNHTTLLKTGNHETKLNTGDLSVKCSVGGITMEATKSIELKVGTNSIKIDPSGITIKGGLVTVEGVGWLTAKAPMVQVTSTGILALKGSLTTIN